MTSSVTTAYAGSATLTAQRFLSNVVAEDGGKTAKDFAARKKIIRRQSRIP